MYLTDMTPEQVGIGYGRLGTGGALGYEDKLVTVGGAHYPGAVSSHPPARLLYPLGAAARRFDCRVALNDDVPPGISQADFAVCVDGREVAAALEVTAGEPPRALEADVTGGHLLELLVTTSQWDHCHAVWLDPQIDGDPAPPLRAPVPDPLGRTEITPPPALAKVERCVVTAASAGYAGLLDDMLGSLVANGNCPDARLVVMLLGDCAECEEVVAKYRALPVRCRPLHPLGIAGKAALYAAAGLLAAERYICLDADTVVLGDLAPLFAALDALPPASVLAVREGNGRHFANLGEALEHDLVYRGAGSDIEAIVGSASALGAYPLVVNGGLFAGSHAALVAVEDAIRAMPGAVSWLEAAPEISWREQFIFNLALAALGCGVELDGSFNVQLHTTDVAADVAGERPTACWEGRPVRVLHLNGVGREQHPGLRGRYAGAAQPLAGTGGGDGYTAFLRGLRAWLGPRGLAGLAWSFYSTRDGHAARVRDPSVLPVLALLHYLIRANGCVRVLETGTARGVSAACIASAVAHRPGGRVVTFDPVVYDGRAELWSSLPPAIGERIDARVEDSLSGMGAMLAAGERFDAALLDSVHTEAQLWPEFELARQLVSPGGLLLLHDARSFAEVARTLERIEAAGFGVTRLLMGQPGAAEDAGLGLAVIENRRRAVTSA
jgi:predicted O-methyltransferase YrrM